MSPRERWAAASRAPSLQSRSIRPAEKPSALVNCTCMVPSSVTMGCEARLACPVGADYRYDPAAAAFHMGAFLRARLGQNKRG